MPIVGSVGERWGEEGAQVGEKGSKTRKGRKRLKAEFSSLLPL